MSEGIIGYCAGGPGPETGRAEERLSDTARAGCWTALMSTLAMGGSDVHGTLEDTHSTTNACALPASATAGWINWYSSCTELPIAVSLHVF